MERLESDERVQLPNMWGKSRFLHRRKKRSTKGVHEMQNQENGLKTEVGTMEALDLATRLRASIGYLADTTQDEQLCAVLMSVEQTAEILEETLRLMLQGEKKEVVAENIPFD